jgi:hypothetical protein
MSPPSCQPPSPASDPSSGSAAKSVLKKFLAGFCAKEGGKVPAWPQNFLASLPSSVPPSLHIPPLSTSSFFPVVPVPRAVWLGEGREGEEEGGRASSGYVVSAVPGLYVALSRTAREGGGKGGGKEREEEGGGEVEGGVGGDGQAVTKKAVGRQWGRPPVTLA